MRFAKNTQRDTSKVLRLPRKMTMDTSKVLRLPRKRQHILWKRRKSIAPATQNDFRHVPEHVWMSRSATPATRNEATTRLPYRSGKVILFVSKNEFFISFFVFFLIGFMYVTGWKK